MYKAVYVCEILKKNCGNNQISLKLQFNLKLIFIVGKKKYTICNVNVKQLQVAYRLGYLPNLEDCNQNLFHQRFYLVYLYHM